MNPIQMIKVNQWLEEWNTINFTEDEIKPDEYFYIFSIKASTLRTLSGVNHREANSINRKNETGIQRKHDEKRSSEIREYISYGYPWSSLTESQRKSEEYHDLKKPGWLPTSIIVNILGESSKRKGRKIDKKDLIKIENSSLILPRDFNNFWEPQPESLYPIEIIDGQHRLWAFDKNENIDFEIPVVAFNNLELRWQAYLFWVINIKPKKINPSLAFDMYPLLRDQEWLDKGESHIVYRETRAQEITEMLWMYSKSCWHNSIDMLGGNKELTSQNTWIKALTSSFIKKWEKYRNLPGGLFGSKMNYNQEVLDWSRLQQISFIVYIWNTLYKYISESKESWILSLREGVLLLEDGLPIGKDPAFFSSNALISTDQGIRALLNVFNDLFYLASDKLLLQEWNISNIENIDENTDNEELLNKCIISLEGTFFCKYIHLISQKLVSFDWRTQSSTGLTKEERTEKKKYKGAGGYKDLRIDILYHLKKSMNDPILDPCIERILSELER